MKTFTFLIAFFLCQTLFAGRWLPEETIGKAFWGKLDEPGKIIFLTGYRIGQGPHPDETAKEGFRILREDHFPALAKKIDAFYADGANENVFLSFAILISFMEMADAPKAKIDEFREAAHNPFNSR